MIESEQLRAVARLLLGTGDITPTGARVLISIADEAEDTR